MNKQHVLCILTLVWIILAAVPPGYSQPNQTSIQGKVQSVDGTPIEGVSVLLTGRNTGTSTGINGKFKLDVPAGTKG